MTIDMQTIITSHDEDDNFWDDQTSKPLNLLMKSAGYTQPAVEKCSVFVRNFIVPHSGPAPTISALTGVLVPHFDSFCTDDFSPVELSWNLSGIDDSTCKMTIRIGFEPISRLAGTANDPFNQDEPIRVMSKLIADKGVDGQLWHHFKKHLHVEDVPSHIDAIMSKMAPDEHMTTNHIAFDLPRDPKIQPIPKVYFYPVATSLLLDVHAREVVTDMVCRLEKDLHLILCPSFDKIRDFVLGYNAKCAKEAKLRLEMVAFDAVLPENSRFKIYLRTKETSLARLQEIWTLGGALAHQKSTLISKGLEVIESFYLRVLGMSSRDAEISACNSHRTAGLIFNFELGHGDPVPRPKVYIPIRHYGGTDLEIAHRLSEFFRWCGWLILADKYVYQVQEAL